MNKPTNEQIEAGMAYIRKVGTLSALDLSELYTAMNNTRPTDVETVARAARDFCAELCEDSPDVPQPQLKRLHEALDIWEMIPPDEAYDDSTPTSSLLASLKWIVEDGNEPDRVRRTARAAIAAIRAIQG